MPLISRDQSMAECDRLMQVAVDARRDRDRVAEIEALHGCLAHPCAAHEFDTVELWSELAEAFRAQSRYDEAIEAWEGAIVAGYQGLPHPRANIAEILIEAGRRGEGDAVYQRLREECGDDVWLYNSAGWAYAHAGDDGEAVSWLERGMELAMATGDSDDVLSQLAGMREECLVSLGRPIDDELAARVAAFERPPGLRGPYLPSLGEGEPSPAQACEHCGWDEAEEDATHMPITEVEALANALRRPAPVPAPPVTTDKVGRNQPCPCGSARKYKHCHG